MKSDEPKYLRNKFVNFNHSHNTRFVHNFRVPLHRTTAYQKSFVFIAAHLWNALPDEHKNLSKKTFSKHIKTMLLEQQLSD